MIPTRTTFRDITSFPELISVHPYVNCVSREDTSRRSYDNILEMLEGCVESGDFLNAVTVDVTKPDVDFASTCRALHVRRTNAFVRAVETAADSFIEEQGTYATYHASNNALQNFRNRQKTFVRHTITQVAENITTHFGRNTHFVNAILDGDGSSYGAMWLPGYVEIFDINNQRDYIMAAENPPAEVRRWLRENGYQRASTNMLWYRDLASTTTRAECVAQARAFATMLLNIKTSRIASDRTEARQIQIAIASL